MGSSSSKPVRSTVSAVSQRKYPKKASPPPTGPSSTQIPQRAAGTIRERPSKQTVGKASTTRSEAIDLDARDPHFAASLRSIGPVTPQPTFSNSSAFNRPGQTPSVFPTANNPALLVVTARQRITKAAEQEAEAFGRESHVGREFLDALTIRQALTMRDRQGKSAAEIENALRLKPGVMERLGRQSIVSEAR
ncbi:hypothetical protein DTO027B5_1440 [Paecilomyces variotii]|nr:hypothetical protein DTO207G8_3952 [Paecilomyces variotii]KAJ9290159.1 hypothetical protein DTO021C3_2158 [Paecilomyces variotii]KAJ9328815.1 hypothetical protein DTO027B3_1081 [Paecilomyces variotii]KAJ9336905.1 hypothetical protein DTO027B5_1440 [Paecilomyces variotii]KAJ9392648.1 hypothetical protein DTO063F5_448 [Paecilomyces variotii]